MKPEIVLIVAAAMCLAILVFLISFFSIIRLWLEGVMSGTPVSLIDLLRLRLRKCPPRLIVRAMIILRSRGIKVPVPAVEEYYLAAVASGEQIGSPEELADLVEATMLRGDSVESAGP